MLAANLYPLLQKKKFSTFDLFRDHSNSWDVIPTTYSCPPQFSQILPSLSLSEFSSFLLITINNYNIRIFWLSQRLYHHCHRFCKGVDTEVLNPTRTKNMNKQQPSSLYSKGYLVVLITFQRFHVGVVRAAAAAVVVCAVWSSSSSSSAALYLVAYC